jgi:branched-chain amino acid transport system ATP-binding protein
MIRLDHVSGGYGLIRVLFDVSLAIEPGEVISLIGRNGMGKTTTVRAIMGLLPTRAGAVSVRGRNVSELPTHKIARLGIGLVPEGRGIFTNLTVRENLFVAAADRRGAASPWTLERVFALFPRLAERAGNGGGELSGGEQQMLAIGRALMTNPELLILDEATEGLAPIVREEIWRCLDAVKQQGMSILVIDKEIERITAFADRHYVLDRGSIAWSGSSAQLAQRPDVVETYLGV